MGRNATAAGLPLVFALAMAVEASAAPLSGLQAGTGPLQPGQLRPLVTSAEELLSPASEEPGDGVIKMNQRFSQFRNFPNFFNCINGNWRNC